jgi:cobalt-precorrin 5A hydrolase
VAAGTASVAEAAALLGAGPGASLILPKMVFARITVAIAG